MFLYMNPPGHKKLFSKNCFRNFYGQGHGHGKWANDDFDNVTKKYRELTCKHSRGKEIIA